MSAYHLDVLCVGAAGYDFTFAVPTHPADDEKQVASALVQCGGGPAANAAVAVARLGCRAAFAGTLGQDVFGDRHLQELATEGVDTTCVRRVPSPTPVSAILVKPDGRRTVVAHGNQVANLEDGDVDLARLRPRVVLFDGHEPVVSPALARHAATQGIVTVLDAGSVHQGTLDLLPLVDHAVCSRKFATGFAGTEDLEVALQVLSRRVASVVITLGDEGVIWRTRDEQGEMPAFNVDVVDTTGAGDAFHGAFAAGLAAGHDWLSLLRIASATAALCCTRLGARPGLPATASVARLLAGAP